MFWNSGVYWRWSWLLSDKGFQLTSVQLLSRVWLFATMDCSTPGFPVHHQLPELAQTQVHRVGDAIQPSSSVVPFSSCLQSFPASGSFPMSQLFPSCGQSIGASTSASVLPMKDFNMLSGFVIAFLPRSKHLLISVTICSNSGAQENKVCHCFHYFPIYLPWSDGTRCHS